MHHLKLLSNLALQKGHGAVPPGHTGTFSGAPLEASCSNLVENHCFNLFSSLSFTCSQVFLPLYSHWSFHLT